MDEWIKVSWDGMEWVVKKGYEQFIPSAIWEKATRPTLFPECHVLKDNILRTALLISLSAHDQQTIFFKRHRRRSWKDDLTSLFIPSRAFSEWKLLVHFKRLNLPAPSPIAYGEKRHHGILKDSCLITEAILHAEPLTFYLSKQCASEKKEETKIELLSRLAQLIAQLHQKGGYYRDLHGGNILCQTKSGGKVDLLFVDTDKVRFVSKMTWGRKSRDLAMLYNSIRWDTKSTWVRFLQAYLAETNHLNVREEKIFSKIEDTARGLTERHLKSRSKRCLKKSTSFEVTVKGRQKRYVRKELSEDILEQVVAKVEKSLGTSQEKSFGKAVKFKRFRISPPQNYPSLTLWVRYYHYNSWERVKSLIGFSPGKAAWFNSNGLGVRQILTPKPLALVEKKEVWGIKSSIFITEDVSFLDRLNDYLLKHFIPKNRGSHFVRKRTFLKCFSDNLSRVYEKKVYFENLKAEKILVEEKGENSWRFYFENVDRIVFNHPVSDIKKMKNLLQLHATIPSTIGGKDRLRFLCYFLRPLSREKGKAFIRKVLAQIT
ncbi:MAG: lipopolysaccharide kinase InaA family protein [Pseudomonadota bacterium]